MAGRAARSALPALFAALVEPARFQVSVHLLSAMDGVARSEDRLHERQERRALRLPTEQAKHPVAALIDNKRRHEPLVVVLSQPGLDLIRAWPPKQGISEE